MLQRSKLFLGLVVTALLVMGAAPVLALNATDCGPRIAGPATLVSAVVLGENGEALPEVRAELAGHRMTLGGLGPMAEGTSLRLNDHILRGVVANAGDRPVLLTFSDGQAVRLEAGQEVAVADNAKCECQCTCRDDEGNSTEARFPCSGNDDDCAYDGDLCTWTDSDGESHVGRYVACLKVWVISSDTEPAGN